ALSRSRRQLRAARERRAGVHRGAPASAGPAARRADPARRARLLRRGGRGGARHEPRRGLQRAAARPQDGGGAAARADAAGDAAQAFVASEVVILTLDGDRITELTIFRDPALLPQFGLPDRL